MRVLVCGEGDNDIGKSAYETSEGTLQVLVSRLLEGKELEFERQPVMHLGARRRHGGFKEKLKLAFAELAHKDCEGLVFVVDRDREEKRGERLRKARDEVSEGKPSAVGVAIRTLEAWLLADETAFKKAFQADTPSTTKDPESIKEPKKELQGRLDAVGHSQYSEAYVALARHSRLEVLEQRCPEGFGRFADEVRELVGAV